MESGAVDWRIFTGVLADMSVSVWMRISYIVAGSSPETRCWVAVSYPFSTIILSASEAPCFLTFRTYLTGFDVEIVVGKRVLI